MSPVNRAPRPSGLADVLDLILDKGVVIDAYVRVALVGIEILTIDLRVVIASVDTYLRFAEAVNRLDLQPSKQVAGLPGLMEEITEGGAKHKTKGALSGVRESAQNLVSSMRRGDDEAEEESGGTQSSREAPAKRAAPAERRGSQSK
jgi:hypothetical protein